MIETFVVFAIAFIFSAVLCYCVGRADGYVSAVEATRRAQQEAESRRNLAINKQIIDHAIRRKV